MPDRSCRASVAKFGYLSAMGTTVLSMLVNHPVAPGSPPPPHCPRANMDGSDKYNPWGAAAKPHPVHADTIFRAGERHGTAPGIGTIERTFSAASARSESRGPAGSSAEARDPGSPRRIAPATRGRTLPTRAFGGERASARGQGAAAG